MTSRPAWATSPAVWETAKSHIRRRYGIHTGERFTELVQAEYIALGGQVHRPGFRKSREYLVEVLKANPLPTDDSVCLEKSAGDDRFRAVVERRAWYEPLQDHPVWLVAEKVVPLQKGAGFCFGSIGDDGPRMHAVTAESSDELRIEKCYYHVRAFTQETAVDGDSVIVGLAPMGETEIFEKSYRELVGGLPARGFEEVHNG